MNPEDTLPKIYRQLSREGADRPIFHYKNAQAVFEKMTWGAMWDTVTTLAQGFHRLGVGRGDHVGIISDNRKEWMMCDIALLCLGAVDTPRGSDSMTGEICFILGHADCVLAIVENKAQAEKILSGASALPALKRIILFDMPASAAHIKNDSAIAISSYDELLALGRDAAAEDPGFTDREIDKGLAADLATIIYTSGTTGEPKGVMLPHRSFLFQAETAHAHIELRHDNILLSVLPVWHAFERAVEYYVLSRGASIAYSKPVGKVLLEDIAAVNPHWMASVPRIWESIRGAIYRKINQDGGLRKALFTFFVGAGSAFAQFRSMFQGRIAQFHPRSGKVDKMVSILPLILLYPFKLLGDLLVFRTIRAKLGGHFVAGVSGGGSLPPVVDRFFQAVGIMLLEGYGLTETGPILAVRKKSFPVFGTIGPLLEGVEFRVVDETGSAVGPNTKGLLYVKSPQVMLGYHKRPDETEKVLQDGWLNTGDLVLYTHAREFKIVGRAKETIVLLGGENVEPTPIEETLVQSDYIEQAMLVGQDKKFLGALIIPDMEKIEAFAKEKNLGYIEKEELLENPAIQEQVHEEIQKLINPRKGFKVHERVFRFKLMPKKFEVGRELTMSLKIRRNVVAQMYAEDIESLFE
ncbi:MAG: AMP-binding protein [Spirochaetales bacterium]|jgi:long-chain acyl-CoA synthetase|nr:AMP-binding protein [Spirochaetales bacterium]